MWFQYLSPEALEALLDVVDIATSTAVVSVLQCDSQWVSSWQQNITIMHAIKAYMQTRRTKLEFYRAHTPSPAQLLKH